MQPRDLQTQALTKRASLSDYGAVNGRDAGASSKPLLPPRAASEVVRPSWAAAPIVRQSSSVRALLRVTSVVHESSKADAAARPSTLRSLAGSQRFKPASAPVLRRSATTSNIPPILRAMSSIFEPKPVEKFRCYICFDDAPVTESVVLTSCGHRYCQSCFQSYLSIKINEGHVHPVCFHPVDQLKEVVEVDEDLEPTTQKTCGVAVNDQQIESIVNAEVWTKFNRFRFNQEHEHARECPYCTFTQECVGPTNPTCECGQCGKNFCFFHGNAHEDGTCADYELKNAETDASSRAKIDEISKPCPGCKRDVEKDGGCNHMKCVACETSFCWLCGETIDDAPMPVHFQAASGSACSGKQFDGNDIQIPWWALAYAMVLFLICYPFAAVTALAILPFAWCFASSPRPSVSSEFDKWHTLTMIFYSLLFSLVFFLAMLVVETTVRFVWFIIKLPFRAVAFVVRPLLCCCRPRAMSSETTAEPTHVDLEAGIELDEPKEQETQHDNGRAYAA